MAREPAIRVLHVQGTSMGSRGLTTEYQYGFAWIGVGPDGAFSDLYQVVEVHFRQTPGGQVAEGEVEILEVGLLVLDPSKRAVDGQEGVLDNGAFIPALTEAVAAYFKRKG